MDLNQVQIPKDALMVIMLIIALAILMPGVLIIIVIVFVILKYMDFRKNTVGGLGIRP